jgi:hypothetical protein
MRRIGALFLFLEWTYKTRIVKIIIKTRISSFSLKNWIFFSFEVIPNGVRRSQPPRIHIIKYVNYIKLSGNCITIPGNNRLSFIK